MYPDLLGYLRAGHRLPTADRSQRRAESLRREKPNALFLHRGRHPLARRLRRCLTKRFLRRLKRFSRRLSNGRLLRLGRRDLRHIDQADDTA